MLSSTILMLVALISALWEVSASTPWIDPNKMRCWTIGETVALQDPCDMSQLGLKLEWTQIETELFTNKNLTFAVKITSSPPANVDTPMVSGSMIVCRQASYDCNPIRTPQTGSSYRLPPTAFSPVPANGSVVTLTVATLFAEKHTFVVAIVLMDTVHFIGVTREVMSGSALALSNVQVASCMFHVGLDDIDLELRIKKVAGGLEFDFPSVSNIPDGRLYAMHVHETGDTRSFASALGHFFGACLDPQRAFEAGTINNTALRISKDFGEPIVDTVLDFTGTNGILGRSLILHNAVDNARVSQCLVQPQDSPQEKQWAAIPDFDALVCVFGNGDVISMETDAPTSPTGKILVRYSFGNLKPDTTGSSTGSIIIKSESELDQVVLTNIPIGAVSNTLILKQEGLRWSDFKVGTVLSTKSKDSECTIARADKSGVFYQREYDNSDSKESNAVLAPAVTSASCNLQSTVENGKVAGQIVFTKVSGGGALCVGLSAVTDSNCIRLDYFITGLDVDQSVLSLRFYGQAFSAAGELSPIFQGVTVVAPLDCGDKPSCAKSAVPPSPIITISRKPETTAAAGLIFDTKYTLNGVHNLVGRAMYLHQNSSVDSPPIAQCVIAVDSISMLSTAPISTRPEDQSDSAICSFIDSPLMTGSFIKLKNVLGEAKVTADVILNFETDMFYDTKVVLDLVPLFSSPVALPNIRTVLIPDDDDAVAQLVDMSNVTSVYSLYGMQLGIKSDRDDTNFVAKCVVGFAPASVPATNSPSTSPTTKPPTGPTMPPTLRPLPIDDSQGLSSGGAFVLIVLVLVIGGFLVVVCCGIRRRFVQDKNAHTYGEGIGEWDYQVEMGNSQQVPLKPPKPSMSRFSDDLLEEFHETEDDQELGHIESESGKATGARGTKRRLGD